MSITEFAAAAQKANKDLFMPGSVTSPDAAGNFYYDLKGTSPPKKQKGIKSPAEPPDARAQFGAGAIRSRRVRPGQATLALCHGFHHG